MTVNSGTLSVAGGAATLSTNAGVTGEVFIDGVQTVGP